MVPETTLTETVDVVFAGTYTIYFPCAVAVSPFNTFCVLVSTEPFMAIPIVAALFVPVTW